MKPLFLFLLLFTTSAVALAQTSSWRVAHNSKVRLQAKAEDTAKNRVSIKKSSLGKKGTLVITFTETPRRSDWKRTFAFFDAGDNELLRQDGETYSISNQQLKLLFNRSKVIRVYTWALPTDPEKAAVIRIRRVHLCTLVIN